MNNGTWKCKKKRCEKTSRIAKTEKRVRRQQTSRSRGDAAMETRHGQSPTRVGTIQLVIR